MYFLFYFKVFFSVSFLYILTNEKNVIYMIICQNDFFFFIFRNRKVPIENEIGWMENKLKVSGKNCMGKFSWMVLERKKTICIWSIIKSDSLIILVGNFTLDGIGNFYLNFNLWDFLMNFFSGYFLVFFYGDLMKFIYEEEGNIQLLFIN